MLKTYANETQRKSDIILGSRQELANAWAFVLDCACNNMPYEDAKEIIESWSAVKIVHWVDQHWNGGLDGWAMRGELEYRHVDC